MGNKFTPRNCEKSFATESCSTREGKKVPNIYLNVRRMHFQDLLFFTISQTSNWMLEQNGRLFVKEYGA